MEHGCSVLRTVSPLSSSRLKVGSASITQRDIRLAADAASLRKSQHTARYHPRRRGNEFRVLRKEESAQNTALWNSMSHLDVAGKMIVNTDALCSVGEIGRKPAKCVTSHADSI